MTKSQQQDDLVSAFVASIPTMQTDIALLKQDTGILKDSSKKNNAKSDMILEQLGKLSVVNPAQFDMYKGEVDTRFKVIEKYINDTKPGVAFANAIVSRWTTFLVLLVLTAAVIALIGHFVPIIALP